MHKNSSVIRKSFETAQAVSLVLNADSSVIHIIMSTHCVEILLECTLHVTEN